MCAFREKLHVSLIFDGRCPGLREAGRFRRHDVKVITFLLIITLLVLNTIITSMTDTSAAQQFSR